MALLVRSVYGKRCRLNRAQAFSVRRYDQHSAVSATPEALGKDIQPDDTVANGRVLIESSTDGMKVDQKGNLYLRSTNVAFGDPDAKTLYITAQTRLYRIRLNVPGTRPGLRP